MLIFIQSNLNLNEKHMFLKLMNLWFLFGWSHVVNELREITIFERRENLHHSGNCFALMPVQDTRFTGPQVVLTLYDRYWPVFRRIRRSIYVPWNRLISFLVVESATKRVKLSIINSLSPMKKIPLKYRMACFSSLFLSGFLTLSRNSLVSDLDKNEQSRPSGEHSLG